MSQNANIQRLLLRAGKLPLNGSYYDIAEHKSIDDQLKRLEAKRVEDIIKSTHENPTRVIAEVHHTELNNAGFELFVADDGDDFQLWLIATDDEEDHMALLMVSIKE